MKKEISEYRKKYFLPIQEKYIQRKYLQVSEKNSKMLIPFIEEIIANIEKLPEAVSLLKISVLYSSLAVADDDNKINPCFFLEFFSDEKVIFSSYASVAWLFSDWQEYRDSLYVEDVAFKKYVHRVQTEAFALETVYPVIFACSIPLRYKLKEYIMNLKNITSDFMITLGEYDKPGEPVLIYREGVELSEEYLTEAEDYSYMLFSKQSCKNLDLTGNDFTMAIFNRCRFEKCDFSKADFSDADFYRCGFFDCIFSDNIVNGIRFDECYFQNVSMNGLVLEENEDSYFREVRAEHNHFACKVIETPVINWKFSEVTEQLSRSETVWSTSD